MEALDEPQEDEWASLDRLRGRRWANEVLRRRKILSDRKLASQALVAEANTLLKSDKAALDAFDEKLRPRMKNRRRLLRRIVGGVYKTPDGEFTITSSRKVLDFDESRTDEIIQELEISEIGEPAVVVTKKIGKEALKELPPWYIRSLAPLSVWVGQMLYASVKSTGEKDATNLVRQRRGEK